MEKRRSNKRFVQSAHFCEWQLLRCASGIDPDRTFVLILGTPDVYPAGNNVVELNGYNRWRIVIGIRVIRVTGA